MDYSDFKTKEKSLLQKIEKIEKSMNEYKKTHKNELKNILLFENIQKSVQNQPYSEYNKFKVSNNISNEYIVLMEKYNNAKMQYNNLISTYNQQQHKQLVIQQNQPTQSQQPNVPRCPTCQSTNVSKISDLSRGMSVFAFGLFSSKIGKTMECKNCGYKW